MFSYHNFLFPFRFDYLTNSYDDRHDFYKEISFDERVNNHLENLFELLQKNNWKYEKFEFKSFEYYNEFVYFHDFVKDSLFNQKELNNNATSWYFEKEFENGEFILECESFAWHKIYHLTLKSITLRIFETGIGILSIEVENHKYSDFNDILKINEYSRRIYPPFVGEKFSLDEVIKKYIAKQMTLKLDNQEIKEDFSKFEINNPPYVKIASYILEILGKDIFTQSPNNKDKFLIQPIIDERMFVICWYGNNELAQDISKSYQDNDNWYKYIFVDAGDKTIQDVEMQKKILEKSTYTRWSGYNSLYGITRYSFMLLSNDLETLKKDYADMIVTHMQSVYYQMAILVLTQRASILRFSDEITAISDLDQDKLYERMSSLYKNYLRFVNKLYFKEITSQEQGIEIYTKFQKVMNIYFDIEDLDKEIAKLNNYVYLVQEEKENKEMKKLTQVATFFMPPTFIAGIFGMNVFGEHSLNVENSWWIFMGVPIFMVSSLLLTDKFLGTNICEKCKKFIRSKIDAKNNTKTTN